MQSYLDKICMSEGFKENKLYQSLLRHLVACSLKNETPKEISIGIEVFSKNVYYDPSQDSTVRTYVHTLRKKLHSYYKKQGKHDAVKLCIPKGHYKVEFQEKYFKEPQRYLKTLHLIEAGIILLLLVGIGILFNRNNTDTIDKNNLTWGGILKEEPETIIVLGDHYFFKAHFADKAFNMRNIHINSDHDLNIFLKNIPAQFGKFRSYGKTYFPPRIPLCLLNLSHLFHMTHVPFDLELATKIKWNEITKNNIIYIGSFRALGVLGDLLHNKIQYNTEEQSIILLNDSTSCAKEFTASIYSKYPVTDYALVIKKPGVNNNTLFFFVSTHDIGTLQATHIFTDMTPLKEFERKYLKDKDTEYFEAIFEVKGFSNSSFEHRLVYFNPINN